MLHAPMDMQDAHDYFGLRTHNRHSATQTDQSEFLQLRTLQALLENVRGELEKIQSEMGDAERRIRQQVYEEMTTNMDGYRKRLEDKTQFRAEMHEEEVKRIRKAMQQEFSNEKSILEKQKEEQNEKFNDQLRMIADEKYEAGYRDAGQNIHRHREQIERYEQDIEDLKNKLLQVDDRIEAVRKEEEKRNEHRKELIMEQQSTIEGLEKQLETKKEQLSRFTKEIFELKSQMREQEAAHRRSSILQSRPGTTMSGMSQSEGGAGGGAGSRAQSTASHASMSRPGAARQGGGPAGGVFSISEDATAQAAKPSPRRHSVQQPQRRVKSKTRNARVPAGGARKPRPPSQQPVSHEEAPSGRMMMGSMDLSKLAEEEEYEDDSSSGSEAEAKSQTSEEDVDIFANDNDMLTGFDSGNRVGVQSSSATHRRQISSGLGGGGSTHATDLNENDFEVFAELGGAAQEIKDAHLRERVREEVRRRTQELYYQLDGQKQTLREQAEHWKGRFDELKAFSDKTIHRLRNDGRAMEVELQQLNTQTRKESQVSQIVTNRLTTAMAKLRDENARLQSDLVGLRSAGSGRLPRGGSGGARGGGRVSAALSASRGELEASADAVPARGGAGGFGRRTRERASSPPKTLPSGAAVSFFGRDSGDIGAAGVGGSGAAGAARRARDQQGDAALAPLPVNAGKLPLRKPVRDRTNLLLKKRGGGGSGGRGELGLTGRGGGGSFGADLALGGSSSGSGVGGEAGGAEPVAPPPAAAPLSVSLNVARAHRHLVPHAPETVRVPSRGDAGLGGLSVGGAATAR